MNDGQEREQQQEVVVAIGKDKKVLLSYYEFYTVAKTKKITDDDGLFLRLGRSCDNAPS